MAVSARHAPMTAEKLFALPGDDDKYELVEGVPIRMAPTGGEQGAVTVRIGRMLDEYVEAHGLGIRSGAETGFILRRGPDVVRAPDAAFIAKARIPEAGIPTAYWPFAPDLAVEVVSPSDRLSDVRTRIAESFAAGTRLVWVVEPTTRTVHVHRSADAMQTLGGDDVLSGEDVIPSFRCAVRRLFP